MDLIAPVGAAAATRALPRLGDGGLTVGQVINARVMRVEGDIVQLRWGEQTVSVASRVPLTVGQQVNLMVEEGASGKTLLRMVDDTFGKGRPGRSEGSSAGAGTQGPAVGGRQAPITGVPGRGDGSTGGSPGGQTSGGGAGRSGAGASAGRGVGQASQMSPGGAPGATGSAPTAGPVPGGRWTTSLPSLDGAAVESDPLATFLFEAGSEATDRLAGGSTLPSPAGAEQAGQDRVARAALPTYGRLAQSVGGADAFGQMLAAHGHEIGQALARGPLAPADLGRLLIDIGVHPDEMNAVLVGEMLAQSVTVQEGSVRALRRDLAAAGGTLRDAAPAVALARMGLPITPLSLAIARQMQAGQLDPGAAWGELLPELQRLARFAGDRSQAGMLATELLADWQVPVRQGAEGIGQWLRTAVDQTATPLEAKLARPRITVGGETPPATTPGQDVRARLDLMMQAIPASARGERGALAQALQRMQATVEAEQILNGSSTERSEPRFFAVTLPTVIDQQAGTLQLRVRERDARPRGSGESARPDVVQLRLNLPGLGELGVNVTIGKHSVACHFSAASPFAEKLISASSSELVGRLKRLGYAHTAVDAAHEPPESTAPLHAAAPRLSHVDIKA